VVKFGCSNGRMHCCVYFKNTNYKKAGMTYDALNSCKDNSPNN